MSESVPLCLVAGHICLDIIPQLAARHGENLGLVPGKLVNVGAAQLATGGVVSNTGLALYRLGAPVRLLGKVGDDELGHIILHILSAHNEILARDMICARDESSSYTLVFSPPDVDRMFLHHSGANDTFCAADVPDEMMQDAALLHFGYPPLMKAMRENGGAELETLFRRAKAQSLTTSLDMTLPDPNAESVDWPALLARVLPHVDLFLPSLDELVWMIDRENFGRLNNGIPDAAWLQVLAERVLELGAAIVVIKLGARGLYARVSENAARLERMGRGAPRDVEAWRGRERRIAPFEIEVAGTTGAGDAAIAGFLFGLLNGFSLQQTLVAAAASGACCCEFSDATTGVRSWPEIEARLQNGWAQQAI